MRALVLLALVPAAAGCLSGGPALDSGIEGVVLLGPTCPVEREPPEPGCEDRPYETSLVVTTADQARVVKEFRSDANGTFRVAVAPGTYQIRSAAAADVLPYCSVAEPIIVHAGSYTNVTVSCDSGIR